MFSNRRTVWAERLTPPRVDTFTIVVEADGELIGFAHSVFDSDPVWGALLDNLHVTHAWKRSGIGAQLMGATAQAVLEHRPGQGLYLWVLEPNTAAQAFYAARGGERVGRELRTSPAGDRIVALRYAWADPSTLLID